MKTLRQKIVKGLAWQSINIITRQGLTLIIHIVLARLLVPGDFGIIGMITIFMELSLRLQGAGLGEALTRKKDVSQKAYNFAFYYGLAVGICCYTILFFWAPGIASFYSEPRLVMVIRIITLNLILIPLRGMNRVQLVRSLSFNKIARIEISAAIAAGLIAICFAYFGFGVWSLVIQHLCLHTISTGLFLTANHWLPTVSVNTTEAKGLFSFGSKLMISNFIQIGFRNIFNVIIGKQYSAAILGSYTQGMKLVRMPSGAITGIIKSVSFPAFAKIREDKPRYKTAFRKSLRLTTFLNFPLLVCLAIIADPLIPFVLSEKWRPTIPFFQILVVVGLLEPIKSLFINILKVEGEGGKLIRYVTGTKVFYLLAIGISMNMDLYAIVAGQVIAATLEIATYSTVGKQIGYTSGEFIKDILPDMFMSLLVGGAVYLVNRVSPFPAFITLALDALTGALGVMLFSMMTRNPSFLEIKAELATRLLKQTPEF